MSNYDHLSLREELKRLKYDEPLSEESAHLVRRLLHDLLQATSSCKLLSEKRTLLHKQLHEEKFTSQLLRHRLDELGEDGIQRNTEERGRNRKTETELLHAELDDLERHVREDSARHIRPRSARSTYGSMKDDIYNRRKNSSPHDRPSRHSCLCPFPDAMEPPRRSRSQPPALSRSSNELEERTNRIIEIKNDEISLLRRQLRLQNGTYLQPQERVKQLEDQLHSAKEDLANTQNNFQRLQQEHYSLQTRFDAAAAQSNALQQTLGSREGDLVRLTEALKGADETHRHMIQELELREAFVRDMEGRQHQFEEISSAAHRLVAELVRTREWAREIDKERDTLQVKLDEKSEEVMTLKTRLSALNSKLTVSAQTYYRLQQDNEGLQKHITLLQSEIADLKQRERLLTEGIRHLDGQLGRSRSTLKESSVEDRRTSHLGDSTVSMEDMTLRLSTLEDQLEVASRIQRELKAALSVSFPSKENSAPIGLRKDSSSSSVRNSQLLSSHQVEECLGDLETRLSAQKKIFQNLQKDLSDTNEASRE